MFPPRFDYVAPQSLDEVLATLEQRGEDAKILAGGQSLIPLMKLRFVEPALLVDVNRLPGLSYLDQGDDGMLRVGALTRHREVERAGWLATSYPTIAAAAPLIADPLVRNLGTVGGSLAHADPAGDWGSVMLALGAEMVASSRSGQRSIPVRDFFVDLFTTALEPTEMLTEVRIPRPTGPSGGTYLKLERKVGDFATVAVAIVVTLAGGRIERAGIGLTAVGTNNIEPLEAIRALVGAEPTTEVFAEAARLAADAAHPVDDVRGPADYKRSVIRTFVQRGLVAAVAQAQAA